MWPKSLHCVKLLIVASESATIWAKLDECVHVLSEPFRASEIIGWFRRHYPEVKESSLRAHIQSATSNVADRGTLGYRPPLITRIDHGLYRLANASESALTVGGPQRNRAEGSGAKAPGARGGELPTAGGARHFDGTASVIQPVAEWQSELNVQSMVVRHLAIDGWSITSVADTASKAHGVDIVATKEGMTVGVEVKGYPSRSYADPARAHERKPTQPSTQARVWYAGALLAAMRLRTRRPDVLSVIALPDFTTYRNLYEDTAWSLQACGIAVWFVSEDGTVTDA